MILPGLGHVQRGAETAFIELARSLGEDPDVHVELFGSGTKGLDGLNVHKVGCIRRERFEGWPKLPCLRGETHYEELTFVLNLMASRKYRPSQFDVTISCSYPWINWFLNSAKGKTRPLNIYLTQNGDWPCRRANSEFRSFKCDGLVCTNPEYYEFNRDRYPSVLVPNGVDPDVFHPPRFEGDYLDDPRIPKDRPIVLMAAALSPTKKVPDGVRAVARVPEAFMVIVGDGPQRQEIAALAEELIPGRYLMLGSVPREQMASIYRRADVLLHMSQEEPFGIVYLEGASTGLNVVAHEGPIPRWILGDTALFANTSDLETVADQIRVAVRPESKTEYGLAARERVATYWTWRQQAARYREFIETLISERLGRPLRTPERAMAESMP
jgi:glycosyltransferase involved in cell wall biosynthesis